ncbi:L,D-transpeptidase family protein [Pontixanthobacter sp.]|uniref:L,D-transpeptidase family protein n=1 Tax=Pontixanthobacter sp. TaxID=2792078 RepID=UPI003C7A723A
MTIFDFRLVGRAVITIFNTKRAIQVSFVALAAAMLPANSGAQNAAPENLLPQTPEIQQEAIEVAPDAVVSDPVVQAIDAMAEPDLSPVQNWDIDHARALAAIIEGIGADGLNPADYNLAGLRAAISTAISVGAPDADTPNANLNAVASKSFAFLVEDLRDGRTPMDGRKQWFVLDPDVDRYPTETLMSDALASGDMAGVLARIMPEHPDYFRMKLELAKSQAGTKRYKLIQANMDRWRWLPRDLGSQYLMTNVPEYQLRLTVNDKIIRTYRTVVGKPGRTATPQLAESVEGVIFNPTWTVPQSIVKGEGLGARVLNNPAWARRAGYTATRGANGWVSVVQQPGPTNSLGLMKLDMPNRHAIFFHDTPSRHLFKNARRALSHGCIRTENATTLAITLAILQGGLTADEGVEKLKSGKYTKVPFNNTIPAYITYFTMAQDINGDLTTFEDIYGRDAAVLSSFQEARVPNRSRVTGEQIIPIENDPRDIV